MTTQEDSSGEDTGLGWGLAVAVFFFVALPILALIALLAIAGVLAKAVIFTTVMLLISLAFVLLMIWFLQRSEPKADGEDDEQGADEERL